MIKACLWLCTLECHIRNALLQRLEEVVNSSLETGLKVRARKVECVTLSSNSLMAFKESLPSFSMQVYIVCMR